MKCSKRSITIVSALFAVLLSSSMETLSARDADLASRAFAAARTTKRQCMNTCRARYRDCLSLKQIPSSECRGVLACSRFRRHRVRCFDGAGGGSWRDGSLPASSSLRLCA
jgi:hypothetical protein